MVKRKEKKTCMRAYVHGSFKFFVTASLSIWTLEGLCVHMSKPNAPWRLSFAHLICHMAGG